MRLYTCALDIIIIYYVGNNIFTGKKCTHKKQNAR